MKMHLGVEDVPYERGAASVEDVAKILEAKYGVMEKFYNHHESEIIELFTNSLGDGIDAIMEGAPFTVEVFQNGADETEALFQEYLNTEKIAGEGIPTKAALRGYHRNKKNVGRRASFVDEGLYRNNMKAWIEV
jgi:hypothetical protein